MKRFMIAGLATLAFAATAPATFAQPTALNPYTSAPATTDRIAPSELVTLAHRGYLKQQGIPSYLGLTSAYVLGQIQAIDLVRAAIAANQLPASAATDRAYLNAVEAQLQIIERVY